MEAVLEFSFVDLLCAYLPESQIWKIFLFIQTNSFIIFTCPNPVLLVRALGKWVSARVHIYLIFIGFG
jgi:hypothetical protein